jgi:hypothetical protein
MLFENKIVVLSGTFPTWPEKESRIAGTPRPLIHGIDGGKVRAVNTTAINKCG